MAGWTAIWSPEGTRAHYAPPEPTRTSSTPIIRSKTSATSTPHRIWPHGHIQRNRRILLHNRKQQNNHLGKLHRPRKHSPTRPQQNAYARQQSHPRLQRRQTLAMEPPNTQQTTRKRHPHRLHKQNNKMVVHLRRRLGHQPFNALWPGWTLHSKGDNYEWHENITGYKMRDWKQDVAQCKTHSHKPSNKA